MAQAEIRGDYRVTVYLDCEVWQIAYTDGTLGTEHIIDDTCQHYPVCCKCNRKWSPQDRSIRWNEEGQMICPNCQ